ncbi:putative BNR repeat neuraminidase [Marinilabilia salmonicolor]|nr:putative BNR repeat neuraminidase [Marinilabilia salmonicolor]
MRIVIINLLVILMVFQSCTLPAEPSKPRVMELGDGWAKTSVNATIFRKNSVISDEHFQYASWYDSTGNVVVAKRALESLEWQVHKTGMQGNVSDAHNVISMMVDTDGYLHLAWDHHNSALKYCRSIEPGGLEFTEVKPMVGSLEQNGVTYPEFYILPNGDLLFAYRYGGSGGGNLVLNRYNTQEKKWVRLHDNLIDGEGERNAYWQMCVGGDGSLHLSWVWRETWDVMSNHDLCYARSNDGGRTWQKSDGAELEMPITARNAEYALQIPQGSSLINQTSITTDKKGQPYIASYWTPGEEEVPQFFLVFLKNGKWEVSRVSNRKMAFSLKGEGSRRIPVSRPQVLVEEQKTPKVHVIYRDQEQMNRICFASANLGNESLEWDLKTIADVEVGQWEPSYDTGMWKREEALHLFVQNVGQGEGNENLEEMKPQMVKILMFPDL